MALAAILNPIDTNEALVFYYEQDQDIYNLAVLHSSVSGGSDRVFTNRNTIGAWVKPPPSDLGVAIFLGAVRVFGIGKIPKLIASTDDPIAVVSQLSPVNNPIDKVSNVNVQPGDYSVIAVCGNMTDTGYVSFLKEISGTLNLVNYTIDKDASPTSKAVEITVATNSKLASIVNQDKLWVFFQSKNDTGKYIYYQEVKDGNTLKISTTSTAEEGTHLAVVFSSDNTILFLYYRNQDGNIARVWLHNDKWSNEEVAADDAIDEDSAIALVAQEKKINVYFWNAGAIIHDTNDLPSDSQKKENRRTGHIALPGVK